MKLQISFKYRFETAHRLFLTEGPCYTPHGHTWYVEIYLRLKSAPLPGPQNMFMDFKSLKKPWKSYIESLDHALLLNSKDPLYEFLKKDPKAMNIWGFDGDPTTEAIASRMMIKALELYIDLDVEVSEIILEETPRNKVIITPKDV